jgi:multicomponent Na+:H+ antiporter subunit E
MRLRAILVLWLILFWVVLWEAPSAANVLGGAALAVALVLRFPPRNGDRELVVRPVAALRFGAYFARKLVEANAVVAWEVLTPRNRIAEGIVAVPLPEGPPGLTALVADAVSLTPGTLTLEVRSDPPALFVHVLHLESPERTRAEVLALDRRARAAFAPAPEPAS